MRTPFNVGNIWKMRAAKWEGTIYLSLNSTTQFTNVRDEEFKRCKLWGSKFGQYLRSGKITSLIHFTEFLFKNIFLQIHFKNDFLELLFKVTVTH